MTMSSFCSSLFQNNVMKRLKLSSWWCQWVLATALFPLPVSAQPTSGSLLERQQGNLYS